MEKCAQVVIGIYRFGNFIYYKVKIPVIRTILLAFYRGLNLFFVKINFNTELPAECKIGENLIIHHPYGIVVNKGVIMGDNATIGAHSVVNKDVYKNTTVVGVPAKDIKKK